MGYEMDLARHRAAGILDEEAIRMTDKPWSPEDMFKPRRVSTRLKRGMDGRGKWGDGAKDLQGRKTMWQLRYFNLTSI